MFLLSLSSWLYIYRQGSFSFLTNIEVGHTSIWTTQNKSPRLHVWDREDGTLTKVLHCDSIINTTWDQSPALARECTKLFFYNFFLQKSLKLEHLFFVCVPHYKCIRLWGGTLWVSCRSVLDDLCFCVVISQYACNIIFHCRLPHDERVSAYDARVLSLQLQQYPTSVLWIGLSSGHLLLVNVMSKRPIMLTKRHMSSIRCIRLVKATIADKPVHYVMSGGYGFQQRPGASAPKKGSH